MHTAHNAGMYTGGHTTTQARRTARYIAPYGKGSTDMPTWVATVKFSRTDNTDTAVRFTADRLLTLKIAVARFISRVQRDNGRKCYWYTEHPVTRDGAKWGELITDIEGTYIRHKEGRLNADGRILVSEAFDYVLPNERWEYV